MSGNNWKAYNQLKTYITDKAVNVNIKYQRPYTIDNWIGSTEWHIIDNRHVKFPALPHCEWSRTIAAVATKLYPEVSG